MTLDPVFEVALSSPDPIGSLRAMAMDRLARGHDRSAIASSFEEARQQLRIADREADEDAVMDVMDLLVGWCSPHMEIGAEVVGEVPPSTDAGAASKASTSEGFDILTDELRGLRPNMPSERERI